MKLKFFENKKFATKRHKINLQLSFKNLTLILKLMILDLNTLKMRFKNCNQKIEHLRSNYKRIKFLLLKNLHKNIFNQRIRFWNKKSIDLKLNLKSNQNYFKNWKKRIYNSKHLLKTVLLINMLKLMQKELLKIKV